MNPTIFVSELNVNVEVNQPSTSSLSTHSIVVQIPNIVDNVTDNEDTGKFIGIRDVVKTYKRTRFKKRPMMLIQRRKPFELEFSNSKLFSHEPEASSFIEGKTLNISKLNGHVGDSFAASIQDESKKEKDVVEEFIDSTPIKRINPYPVLLDLFKYIPKKKRTPRYEVFECKDTSSLSNQEEDEKVTKKQRAKKRLNSKRKKPSSTILGDIPAIPANVANRIDEIGGVNTVLVIQKSIFNTDLATNNNRFSIPGLQVISEFLTEEEKRRLNPENPMQVSLLDPSLRQIDIKLTKWRMNGRDCYNLIEKWNDVVKMNKKVLRVDIVVQLWAYRIESKLNFALVVVK